MNRTIDLIRRTRELLADIQTELVTLAIIEQAKTRAEACGQKPRKREIKAKINGGRKWSSLLLLRFKGCALRLDEVKELVEKGLTNAAIAEAVKMSVRQVQRLKRRLLEAPVRLPKTSEALIKLLQKKAAQGDLIALRTLLKEYKATTTEKEKIPTFPWWFFWLTDEEREIAYALVNQAEQRQQKWPHKTRRPVLSDIEALAETEREETPTPPSSPSIEGSTGEEDPKPSLPEVGDTAPGEGDPSHSHLVNPPEGRELPPSPLVNHHTEVNPKRGGLWIREEK